MNILITGGAGFIGSHTADLLLKKGHNVRILDILEPPVHSQREKPDYIPDDVEFKLGNVKNRNEFEKALEGIDAVFHFAAYQGYLNDFSKFAFTNGGGTALLYEIIVKNHLPIKKVILASSQAVYGEGKYVCEEHSIQYPPQRSLSQLDCRIWDVKCPICGAGMVPSPCDESVVNPHNQYAISKYCQELYAINLGQRYAIPTVVLRYSITQGPRQSLYNAYSGVLRIFTMRLLNNLPPVIYEDGEQLRDYSYIGDIVAANLLVLENDNISYEVFNVGGSNVITVNKYASVIAKLLGKNTKLVIPEVFRFGDVRHIISDVSKLRSLGWEPSTSIEEIANEYIIWTKEKSNVTDFYSQAEKIMKENGIIRSAQKL